MKFEDMLKNEKFYVFKHSITCGVSMAAKEKVDAYEGPIPVFEVIVQTQRLLSNDIAEKLQVRHESPQLILVENGKVKKVLNHYEIEL